MNYTYKGNTWVPDKDQMFSPKTTQGTAGAIDVTKIKKSNLVKIQHFARENQAKTTIFYQFKGKSQFSSKESQSKVKNSNTTAIQNQSGIIENFNEHRLNSRI